MTSPTRTFSIRLDWNNARVLLFGCIFSYSIGKTRFRLIWLIKISLLRSYCVSTERGSVTLGDSKSKEAFCCIVVENFERWRLGRLFVRVQAGYWLNQLFPSADLPVLSLFLTYIQFVTYIAVYCTTNYEKGVTASFERLWRIFTLKQKK